MIPFRRLPGPVIVSKATEEVLNDITNEVLERLDMVGVQVEAAELSNCKERVMLLQTCILHISFACPVQMALQTIKMLLAGCKSMSCFAYPSELSDCCLDTKF